MHHSPLWQFKAKPVEGRETQAPKGEPVWWQSWEFYLIALLAVGLRLYSIDTAQL